MKGCLVLALGSVLTLVVWTAGDANAQGTSAAAQVHVDAAKAAMNPSNNPSPKPWQVFDYLFKMHCTPPKPNAAPAEGGNESQSIPRPHDSWYTPPAKVFDNLYYLGTNIDDIWAVKTSAGIILIDTNFDWDVKELVVDGLKKFGMNASDIKYVVITHAHSDHYWGATTLKQIVPTARILMSEADWNVIAKDHSPANLKPKKDMVITDGQKLTLGDTTITLYITPGHTPGTVSMIIPLKDGNDRHIGGVWGGMTLSVTRNGVDYFPDWPTLLRTYLASLKRFKDIEDKAGVDTIVSIHARHDKTIEKIAALQVRKPGEPNPFVSKDDLNRYVTLISECVQAQQVWRTSSSN
jgi:metallo-beta-lactamase class B